MSKNNVAAVIANPSDDHNLTAVKPVPYPTLRDDEIIIRAEAYAINPTDWKHIQVLRPLSELSSKLVANWTPFGLGKYTKGVGGLIGTVAGGFAAHLRKGIIAGTDVSGIVEEVGKNVQGFEKGDLVGAVVSGGVSKVDGGFSKYVAARKGEVIKYPKNQIKLVELKPGDYVTTKIDSFERIAASTLGLATVAISLGHHLEIPEKKQENADKYILIWGGATATGVLAIQIAKVVYGLKVIATASTKNHSLLKQLGADVVFDYKDLSVVEEIKSAGQGKIFYALDTVSTPETLQSVYDATEGSPIKVIDNLLMLNGSDVKQTKGRDVKFTTTLGYVLDGKSHFGIKATPKLFADYEHFWTKLLPPVLDQIKSAPLKVLKKGLGSVNQGLELSMNNKVSGQKIVFRS